MSTKPIILPSQPTLWFMRIAALAALGVAIFLAVVHALLQDAMHDRSVPFCSGVSWLDCDTVLRSKWSYWFGIFPVAFPAVLVWGIAAQRLISLSPRHIEPKLKACGIIFQGLGVVIGGAAVWFIAIQATMGQWCSWCMVEHAIGLILTGPLLIHGFRLATRLHYKAILLAVIALVLLIVGQVISEPNRRLSVTETEGRWHEPDASISLFGGAVKLDPTRRPNLGGSIENGVVLYVFDYTCHNCRAVHGQLTEALTQMGDRAPAVLVVLCPLNSECNRHIVETLERYRDACDIARLALIVQHRALRNYALFHHWLFENGKHLTPKTAGAEAKRLMEGGAVTSADQATADRRLEQDVALCRVLGVTGLPALIVGDQRMTLTSMTTGELVDWLGQAPRP